MQQFVPEGFKGEPKNLTPEEIEKIFSKYTKHFSEFIIGSYEEETDEEE